MSVTINAPDTGAIHYVGSYSGTFSGLQPGQTIWTFNQPVGKNGDISPTTFPDNGPCNVNLATKTWNCSDTYVGNPSDTGTYRVCAAILSPAEANTVVTLLANVNADSKLGYTYWFTSPPAYINDHSRSCMSAIRVNG